MLEHIDGDEAVDAGGLMCRWFLLIHLTFYRPTSLV